MWGAGRSGVSGRRRHCPRCSAAAAAPAKYLLDAIACLPCSHRACPAPCTPPMHSPRINQATKPAQRTRVGQCGDHGVVAPRVLNGQNVSVHGVQGGQDVGEFRVAQVRDDLGGGWVGVGVGVEVGRHWGRAALGSYRIAGHGGSTPPPHLHLGRRRGGAQAEGVHCPLQVLGAARLLQGQALAQGGLVHLHSQQAPGRVRARRCKAAPHTGSTLAPHAAAQASQQRRACRMRQPAAARSDTSPRRASASCAACSRRVTSARGKLHCRMVMGPGAGTGRSAGVSEEERTAGPAGAPLRPPEINCLPARAAPKPGACSLTREHPFDGLGGEALGQLELVHRHGLCSQGQEGAGRGLQTRAVAVMWHGEQ